MVHVFIKTYGCQANVADSISLEKYLCDIGCLIVRAEGDADIILINTCAIRAKAEQRFFSYLGSLVPFKTVRPHLAIGVIGCIASYRKEEIFKRFDSVSFVFGAREDIETLKAELSDLIESVATKKLLYVGPARHSFSDGGTALNRSMINIMRGCNNYCSYCIVPFTTGRERSFAMSKILEQIKRDVAAGAKEVTLLGQNVDSYKDPETDARFSTLLKKVGQIDGEFWVRFVSPHPKDMTTDVLDVMAANKEKLCAYIHFPLQSGSNRILDLMCRTYTVEKYLEQIAAIRKRLPHAAISTDFIIGFPGETEEDYRATRKVMEEVRFNMIYSFIYSPRKYTKAAQMIDSCSHEVKQRRLAALQARHREIGTERNKEFIGKTVRVLIESRVSCEGWRGRTEGNIRVLVSGKNLVVNKFVNVLIEEAGISQIDGTTTQDVASRCVAAQDCKHSSDNVESRT